MFILAGLQGLCGVFHIISSFFLDDPTIAHRYFVIGLLFIIWGEITMIRCDK